MLDRLLAMQTSQPTWKADQDRDLDRAAGPKGPPPGWGDGTIEKDPVATATASPMKHNLSTECVAWKMSGSCPLRAQCPYDHPDAPQAPVPAPNGGFSFSFSATPTTTRSRDPASRPNAPDGNDEFWALRRGPLTGRAWQSRQMTTDDVVVAIGVPVAHERLESAENLTRRNGDHILKPRFLYDTCSHCGELACRGSCKLSDGAPTTPSRGEKRQSLAERMASQVAPHGVPAPSLPGARADIHEDELLDSEARAFIGSDGVLDASRTGPTPSEGVYSRIMNSMFDSKGDQVVPMVSAHIDGRVMFKAARRRRRRRKPSSRSQPPTPSEPQPGPATPTAALSPPSQPLELAHAYSEWELDQNANTLLHAGIDDDSEDTFSLAQATNARVLAEKVAAAALRRANDGGDGTLDVSSIVDDSKASSSIVAPVDRAQPSDYFRVVSGSRRATVTLEQARPAGVEVSVAISKLKTPVNLRFSASTSAASRGINLVRDYNFETFWQSAGSRPHMINVTVDDGLRDSASSVSRLPCISHLDIVAPSGSYQPRRITIDVLRGSTYMQVFHSDHVFFVTAHGSMYAHIDVNAAGKRSTAGVDQLHVRSGVARISFGRRGIRNARALRISLSSSGAQVRVQQLLLFTREHSISDCLVLSAPIGHTSSGTTAILGSPALGLPASVDELPPVLRRHAVAVERGERLLLWLPALGPRLLTWVDKPNTGARWPVTWRPLSSAQSSLSEVLRASSKVGLVLQVVRVLQETLSSQAAAVCDFDSESEMDALSENMSLIDQFSVMLDMYLTTLKQTTREAVLPLRMVAILGPHRIAAAAHSDLLPQHVKLADDLLDNDELVSWILRLISQSRVSGRLVHSFAHMLLLSSIVSLPFAIRLVRKLGEMAGDSSIDLVDTSSSTVLSLLPSMARLFETGECPELKCQACTGICVDMGHIGPREFRSESAPVWFCDEDDMLMEDYHDEEEYLDNVVLDDDSPVPAWLALQFGQSRARIVLHSRGVLEAMEDMIDDTMALSLFLDAAMADAYVASDGMPFRRPGNSNGASAAVDPDPTWECPRCTLQNPQNVTRCMVCAAARPAIESNTPNDDGETWSDKALRAASAVTSRVLADLTTHYTELQELYIKHSQGNASTEQLLEGRAAFLAKVTDACWASGLHPEPAAESSAVPQFPKIDFSFGASAPLPSIPSPFNTSLAQPQGSELPRVALPSKHHNRVRALVGPFVRLVLVTAVDEALHLLDEARIRTWQAMQGDSPTANTQHLLTSVRSFFDAVQCREFAPRLKQFWDLGRSIFSAAVVPSLLDRTALFYYTRYACKIRLPTSVESDEDDAKEEEHKEDEDDIGAPAVPVSAEVAAMSVAEIVASLSAERLSETQHVEAALAGERTTLAAGVELQGLGLPAAIARRLQSLVAAVALNASSVSGDGAGFVQNRYSELLTRYSRMERSSRLLGEDGRMTRQHVQSRLPLQAVTAVLLEQWRALCQSRVSAILASYASHIPTFKAIGAGTALVADLDAERLLLHDICGELFLGLGGFADIIDEAMQHSLVALSSSAAAAVVELLSLHVHQLLDPLAVDSEHVTRLLEPLVNGPLPESRGSVPSSRSQELSAAVRVISRLMPDLEEFWTCYAPRLESRLLARRYVSLEREEAFLLDLHGALHSANSKVTHKETGWASLEVVSKMRRQIRDLRLSEDMHARLQKTALARLDAWGSSNPFGTLAQLFVEGSLRVTLLNQHSWTKHGTLALPPVLREIPAVLSTFVAEEWKAMSQHSADPNNAPGPVSNPHRTLMWHHAHDTVVLDYSRGQNPVCDLVVSGVQATVLLLLGQQPDPARSVSFDTLATATRVGHVDLELALLALMAPLHPVLIGTPPVRSEFPCFDPGASFALNPAFQPTPLHSSTPELAAHPDSLVACALLRAKHPVVAIQSVSHPRDMSGKADKEDHMTWRKAQIDAAVMRTLKQATVPTQLLTPFMHVVQRSLSSRFVVSDADVKSRILRLVREEFINAVDVQGELLLSMPEEDESGTAVSEEDDLSNRTAQLLHEQLGVPLARAEEVVRLASFKPAVKLSLPAGHKMVQYDRTQTDADGRLWPYRKDVSFLDCCGPFSDAMLRELLVDVAPSKKMPKFYTRPGIGTRHSMACMGFYPWRAIRTDVVEDDVKQSLMHISASREHFRFSVEELRIEDYTGLPCDALPYPVDLRPPTREEIDRMFATVKHAPEDECDELPTVAVDPSSTPPGRATMKRILRPMLVKLASHEDSGNDDDEDDEGVDGDEFGASDALRLWLPESVLPRFVRLSESRSNEPVAPHAHEHHSLAGFTRGHTVSLDGLSHQLYALLTRLSSVTELETGQVVMLLQRHKWNDRVMLETLLERPVATCSSVNIAGVGVSQMAPLEVQGQCECAVCFDEWPQEKMLELFCGHRFCFNCWSSHAQAAIEADQCLRCKCMMPECKAAVTGDVFFRIAEYLESLHDDASAETAAHIRKRYHAAVLRSYVSDHADMDYCPQPHCGAVVVAQADEVGLARGLTQCGMCGHVFCRLCPFPNHFPATCADMKAWEDLGGYVETTDEEKNTRRMVALTTKPCPKCARPIEKNGGCPHLRCVHCEHEFCWNCLGPYRRCYCNNPRPTGAAATQLTRTEKFGETNKRCANHALSCEIAKDLATYIEDLLASHERASAAGGKDSRKGTFLPRKQRTRLRALHVAARVLVDVHRTLAHACVRMYSARAWEGIERFQLLRFRQEELSEHADRMQEVVEGSASSSQSQQQQAKPLVAHSPAEIRHEAEALNLRLASFVEALKMAFADEVESSAVAKPAQAPVDMPADVDAAAANG